MQNVHPFFVHFPIALLSVGILIDITGAYRDSASMRQLGWALQALGLAGAVAAVASGLWAERAVAHVEDAHAVMQNHKRLGFVVLGLFAALFTWRTYRRDAWHRGGPETGLYGLVGLAAIATLLLGAKLGGDLVYDYGVGTSVVTLDDDHRHDGSTIDSPTDEGEAPAGHADAVERAVGNDESVDGHGTESGESASADREDEHEAERQDSHDDGHEDDH